LSTIKIPIDENTGLPYELYQYSISEDGTVTGVDKQNRVIPIGKVCIVSNISGTADYIQDYRNGFVFQKENPDELAQNMLWCMENFDKLEKIGEQAAVTYEENFSMEIFRNNLEEAINNSL